MTPIEKAANNFGLIGSPALAGVILCGPDHWIVKIVALMALAGLFYGCLQRVNKEA